MSVKEGAQIAHEKSCCAPQAARREANRRGLLHGLTHERPAFQHTVSVHRQLGALDHRRSNPATSSAREASTLTRPAVSRRGSVNPHTITLLQGLGYDTSGFRSKSWNEFAKPGAPALDFVFTVCDNAAGEACPVWPGQPMTAHWGVPDPAEAKGTPAEIALAFKDAYRMLHQRIGVFTALPIRSLDQLSLQMRLKEIGRMEGATSKATEPT